MIQGRSSTSMFSNISNWGSLAEFPEPVEERFFVSNLNSYILSYGHDLSRIGKADVGGPFELFKIERNFGVIELPAYRKMASWTGGTFTCDIGFLTHMPSLADANLGMDQIRSSLRAESPHCIAMSNPTRPESEILVAAVDTVKDGIPHLVGHTLWRERTLAAKSAAKNPARSAKRLAGASGDEYLNVQFGWLPLVSDIKKFAKTVLRSSQVISQYERGSGKRQRRGWRVHVPQKETRVNTSPPFSSYPANGFIWHSAPVQQVLSYRNEVWFEGAFRYYLAPTGMERYVQLASKLYGVRLTPDVLWELAPWSWALDWFGNAGDVIANISMLGSDASVMEWGYMMGHDIMTNTISQTLRGQTMNASSGHPSVADLDIPLAINEVVAFKSRLPGSPYSFAVVPAPLTATQTAILVSLGLSRLT